METPKRQATRADYEARMLRVLVYIQGHLDEALDLEALAAVAHFSPFHFHRVFCGMVGESVQGHVRRLRLERAAHRLKYTDHPVTRIAFEAGYEAHEAFTRAFKTKFGKPPTDFRKRHLAEPGTDGGTFEAAPPVFRLAEKDTSSNDVGVEDLDGMRVVFMRHTGPYDQVGDTWSRLFAWAGPRGLIGPIPTTFGVLHDDPAVTPPERVRYDACLVVVSEPEVEGAIGCRTIPGGRYAVTRHVGPYDQLDETYRRLCGEWLPRSGEELKSAPALEFYRNSPLNTSPEKLVTDVFMPLEDEP